jgi:hypothetical protein
MTNTVLLEVSEGVTEAGAEGGADVRLNRPDCYHALASLRLTY